MYTCIDIDIDIYSNICTYTQSVCSHECTPLCVCAHI